MKVSIIVPIYNTEAYLAECVESILNQTFRDFELLLVDDGSTDGSGALCDQFQAKDSRVQVFHLENGGVSAARNYGVQQAKGEWICYVDSDDTVLPDYLKCLIEGIVSDRCIVLGNISDKRVSGFLHEDITLHGVEAIRYLLDTSALFNSGPWAKLFNHALLSQTGITFPVGIHYGEDMIYFFKYLNEVDDVVIRKDVNYLFRLREGSLTTAYYSYESEHACFEMCLEEITRLVSRLDVSPDEQSRLVWSNKVSDAFIRCPKCLYAGNEQYGFWEKYRLLKAIPADYFRLFGKLFRPQGFSSQIVTSLICRRQFVVLLFIGAAYEKLRLLKKRICKR